jgi:hypothetical protein
MPGNVNGSIIEALSAPASFLVLKLRTLERATFGAGKGESVQPADLSNGLDFSSIVYATMPCILAQALAVLRKWNLIDKEYNP